MSTDYDHPAWKPVRKLIAKQVVEDLLIASADNEFFAGLIRIAGQQMMRDNFAEPEELRQELLRFVYKLEGLRDAFRDYPWTRFPRDLGYNGHLAKMTGGEVKVFMALLSLVEPRTLVTFASVNTIAKTAGRSVSRTSRLLTSLKKKELIERWAKKPEVQRDEWHFIWFTRIVPEACCESSQDANKLVDAPVVPAALGAV